MVQSPADEDRYIIEFASCEDNQLDKDAMGSNPVKRGLAKLFLNSMWGKLTERNNGTRTKMISDPQELYRFLATPVIEVATLMFASDVVWASWRYIAEEKVPNLRHERIYRSIRHRWGENPSYTVISTGCKRALYCDTDSVIYIELLPSPAG